MNRLLLKYSTIWCVGIPVLTLTFFSIIRIPTEEVPFYYQFLVNVLLSIFITTAVAGCEFINDARKGKI